MNCECHVEENPNRKKNTKSGHFFVNFSNVVYLARLTHQPFILPSYKMNTRDS